MYAEVIVNMPVAGTFHYRIPSELAGRLRTGHLVEVSFGSQKAQGVVIALSRRSPVAEVKPVLGLVDADPVIDETCLALARWMSDYYLAPLSECVRLFVPPGLARRGDTLITPVIDPGMIEAETENQTRLLALLKERGPLRGRQIAHALPRRNWQKAVDQLSRRGLLLREPVLERPAVQPQKVRIAELAVRPDMVEQVLAERVLGGKAAEGRHREAAIRRAQVLRCLADQRGPLSVSEIYTAVAGSTLADLRALAQNDLIVLRQEQRWRDPLQGIEFVPESPPRLTQDQSAAWEIIRAALDSVEAATPILLHGVTGSGKTELYLRAVEHSLAQGRSAIVLVPEIALTPQTIRRFGARFPGRMGLIHSQLSDGERYDTWRRAREGQLDLIIGPRSALFAPLDNLGLIVLDECHDDSYKQSPDMSVPAYHTIPTAIELARLHRGLVIMGSATPNVSVYAQAGAEDGKDIRLVTLPARIMGHRRAIELQAIHYHLGETRYDHVQGDPDEAVMIDLPPVQIVDMRQELRASHRAIFSRALIAALEETLRLGQQAILFLNRRGNATYIFCRECGHVLLCPRCETPLTWHITSPSAKGGQRGILVCHHCNYRGEHPDVCPACGSEQIRFFGGGTEKVEQEVRTRFPDARPIRWDRDTAANKNAHWIILEQFARQQANVLIGTQMIAKGLDLPLVTLVGVVSADTALYLPDYRSGERTFQLLTQVAGRAGRGLLGGRVIVQTYAPEHYAIRAAAQHDYEGFYRQELENRRGLGYPPYARLVRLTCEAVSREEVQSEMERAHLILSQRIVDEGLSNTNLIGPAPCFYPRRNRLYRWHVIVRGPDPVRIIGDLASSTRLQIDVDPVSLL